MESDSKGGTSRTASKSAKVHINQNVFYELGYAHALGKPTILLAEKGKQLPFDVSGYRYLCYENSIGGKRKVDEALRKHLAAILHE